MHEVFLCKPTRPPAPLPHQTCSVRLPLWRKSSQFFSLTRDHVAAVLNDTAVYRWQVGMWDVHQDGNGGRHGMAMARWTGHPLKQSRACN